VPSWPIRIYVMSTALATRVQRRVFQADP